MKCKICGCSDEKACKGGCVWVDENLCSRCEDIYNHIIEKIAIKIINCSQKNEVKTKKYKYGKSIISLLKGRIKK